jgi:tetratricopeptide (TPR) repeat protein
MVYGHQTLFVGRKHELAELRTGLADALAGRGGLFLLEGEPGIGKTYLAGEIGREAEAQGATTLWGRSWEGEGAPAFWPWRQALRGLLARRDPHAIRSAMGDGVGDLAELLPEMHHRFGDLPRSPLLDQSDARFRVIESVVSFLRAAAGTEPIVLILDDLHWADAASLMLLRLVVRSLLDARVLVVGTYRDADLDPAHPFTRTLGKIARDSRRLTLRGFSLREVERFLTLFNGAAPAPELVTAVHSRSDGNPFFVTEIVRLLESEGRLDGGAASGVELGIPVGVHQTIRRRLDHLSAACRQALQTASVIGREFDVAVLIRVSRDAGHHLLALLAEAEAARLVHVPRTPTPRARFVHALVRDTLYEELSPPDRRRQHRIVAEAIEALAGTDLDGHAPELAWHFARALPDGDAKRAIDYAVRAAESARAHFAYEEAAAQYAAAAAMLPATSDDTGREPERQRCQLLLAQGEAATQAGDVPQARRAFLEVIERTRRLDAAELFARATLGLAGRGDATHAVDHALLVLLEQAHEHLRGDTSALHARILGRLAMAVYFTDDEERRVSVSRRAVEMAEDVGDPATLAATLSARRFALWTPDDLDERVAVSGRIVDLARIAGAPETAVVGHLWRLIDLLELGDIAGVDRDIARYTELAEELRQPYYRWHAAALRAMRALLAGRLAQAETLIEHAFALGQKAHTPNVNLLYMVQLFTLRREQGRLAELEYPLLTLAEQYPTIPACKSGLALLFAETARLTEARAWFERLAATDFAELPRDAHYLNALDELAQTCHALGDGVRAQRLYERLLPYAGRNVVVGFADACDGPVTRYLGLLATTFGCFDAAADHFEEALAMTRRLGAAPYTAHVERDYAGMLLARGSPGDPARAARLLEDAAAIYEALGMSAYLPRTRALRPAPPDPAPDRRRTFRHDGAYWTLAFDGREVRARDTKGLRYLAELVHHPGRALHVVDLAGGWCVDSTVVPPTPDARARVAYRQRLTELRTELADAERMHDLARTTTLRDELEAVASELASIYGLRGAASRTGGAVDRARKAVTKCIRGEIRRLARVHEPLARHLMNAVHTGVFCVYLPEKPVDWEL